mmetsp:Transcript_31110/g.49833  ORF Transcript_31110/g.49833 Transcript_31110/m.49833 type:complete len:496 (-) Transcript_31110:4085-5572(-)
MFALRRFGAREIRGARRYRGLCGINSRMSEEQGPSGQEKKEEINSQQAEVKNEDLPSYARDAGKKKFAIMFGYSGIGYHGLQINEGVKTIEQDLEAAISKSGVIRESNQGSLTKQSWSRAGRTDKGVHALGQVCSLKMRLHVEDEPRNEFIKVLNDLLPEQIEVFDVRRVGNSFNSKNNCSGRKYEYVLPTYLFAPRKELWEQSAKYINDKKAEKEEKEGETEETGHSEFSTNRAIDHQQSDLDKDPKAFYANLRDEATASFTFDENMQKRFNEVLQMFVGAKNFHNFTVQVASDDPSAIRNVTRFEAGKPFVQDGLEMVRVLIDGQSFMLHQIRRMISVAIEVTRRGVDKEVVNSFFEPGVKRTVYMVPGEGLALRACLYKLYNKKFGQDMDPTFKGAQKIRYQSIDFFEDSIVEKVDSFEKKVVFPTIVKADQEEFVFGKWARTTDHMIFPAVGRAETKKFSDVKEKRRAQKKRYKESKKRGEGKPAKQAKVE